MFYANFFYQGHSPLYENKVLQDGDENEKLSEN
jgi:hypothetical protein